MFLRTPFHVAVLLTAVFGSAIYAQAAPPTPTGPTPGTTSSPGPVQSSSSVTLRWNASSGATTYGVGVRDMSTNVLVVDANTSSTSYSVALNPSRPYRWNVNACNSTGCSSFTTPLYFQTPAAIPPMPGNTSPGSTSSPGPTTASPSVTLSWSASSGATTYGVGVRDMSTNVLVVDANTSSTSYSVALNSGRPYRWNVNACNSAGCSSFTTQLYFQTPTTATLPGAPQNLAASGGNGVVGLAWNAPASNGGATITNYRVFRGTTSSNRQIVTSGGCANLGAVLGCADTSVTNGQSYNYIVSAVNSVGQGPGSNSATATPASGANLPSAPQNLAASGGNGLNGLAWNAPSSNGGASITSYRVFRGTNSSNRLIVTSGGCANLGAVLSCADTGLTNGQSYDYIVSAVNSVGQGPPSNSATATPMSSTSPPTISSVSPNPVPASTSSQTFTINGSGFTSNSTVTLRSPFQTYPNQPTTSKSPNQIVMQVTLGTTAAQWTVEVFNGTASSGQFPFQVSAPSGTFALTNNAPVCDTNPPVAPAVRLNWNQSNGATSYDLYRNGTLYTSGLTGLTFYNNLNVTAGQTYTYFVRARHSSGSVDSNSITVVVPTNICNSASPPTISSINPSNVTVNQVTVLTVNGSNFKSGFGASVTTSLGTFNIAAAGLTFVNGNQVLVQVTMGGTPPLTATLRITNIDGQSATGTFQVVSQQQAPGALSLSNQTPVCDTNAPVAPAVRLNWTPSNNATSYDLYRNGTSYVTGIAGTTFYNSGNVVAGQTYSYFIRARNTSGSTDSNTITVTVPSNICSNASSPPLISRITPSAVTVSQTTTLTVIGTNFQSNFGVSVQGSAIDPTGLKFINSGEVTVSVRMGGTPPYSASLVLTNLTDGKTATGTFTVSAPASQSQAPNASFTHSPPSPTTGQSVQFTDTSTGGGLTRTWDFNGDGVTDSQVLNPTHTFPNAGPHEVTLRVSNAYGSDSITRIVTVGSASAGVPVITEVVRKYAGFFLKGSGLDNVYDVKVDWKGSAGTVSFSINGGPPSVVQGNTTGASYAFNLDRDLPPRFSPSVISITPKNAEGLTGTSVSRSVYVFPYPSWLELTLGRNSSALSFTAGSGYITAHLNFDFPSPHLAENGPIDIPTWVPYIGGKFGLDETYAQVGGTFSSAGSGTIKLGGRTGFQAMGSGIGGSVFGSGNLLLNENGLSLQSSSFNVGLNGTLRKEVGVVDAIPQLAGLQDTPGIGAPLRWFNEKAKLIGEIKPALSFGASWQQNSAGNLQFNNASGTLGLTLQGTLRVAPIDRLQASGWVSGGGSIGLGVPSPFVRSLNLTFESGVKVNIDYFFGSADLTKTAAFRCQWTPSGGTSCGRDQSAQAPLKAFAAKDAKDTALTLISPGYDKHGVYSSFQPLWRFKGGNTLISSTAELSLLTNVFPAAAPQIIELGTDSLLVWIHQNPSLPVLQSTNVFWSYSSGTSNWTSPAAASDDTRAELSPVVASLGSTQAVAAWLRNKDTNFVTPINAVSQLPVFYNRFDVVSSVFNATTRQWTPIVSITDDAVFDNALRMASDNVGGALLTWLSNANGEFTSTQSSPSTLKFSFWNGNGWSPAAPIATGLVGVSAIAPAVNGSSAFVIVPRDPNATSGGDGVLDLYRWNGTSWNGPTAFAAGGAENRLPSAVYSAGGEGVVVWLRDNDLVYATVTNPTPHVVRKGSASMAFYNVRLLNNSGGNLTLVWTEVVDSGPANIFAMVYDPSTQGWSADRRLTENQSLAHDVAGYYSRDGKLNLVYLATEINRSTETVLIDGESQVIPNIPREGRTDLQLVSHSLVTDLAVRDNDLMFDVSPREGDLVSGTLTVHNAGDFAVGNFTVKIYAGDPSGGDVLSSMEIADTMRAGERRLLPFAFTMPGGGRNVVALVDVNNAVPEITEINNRATYYANNTAPQARVTANTIAGQAALTVNFNASGSFDMEADPITFTWAFADGSESATGGTVSHTFNQPGTYAVTLTATDSKGAASAAVVNITVTAPAMQVFLDPSAADLNRAAAVDSLLLVKEPFRVLNPSNSLNPASDKNTRVVFFVSNLQLAPGETASSVVVTLTDQNNQTYDIAAQDVRTVPNQMFTQVTFRLPDNLPDGTCVLKVNANGQSSNIGTIRIKN